MGALLAFIDLAGRDPGLGAGGREHLARGQREGERVRRILRQLLDFSSPPRGARVPIDLARLCEETAGAGARAAALRARSGSRSSREGDPPPALADPSAVAQIVLNLLLNAADALCQGSPEPRIRVTRAPGLGPRARGRSGTARPPPRGAAATPSSAWSRTTAPGSRRKTASASSILSSRPSRRGRAPGSGSRTPCASRRNSAARSSCSRPGRAAAPSSCCGCRPGRVLQPDWKLPAADTRQESLERAAQRACAPRTRLRSKRASRGADAIRENLKRHAGLAERERMARGLLQVPGERAERWRSDVSAGTQPAASR